MMRHFLALPAIAAAIRNDLSGIHLLSASKIDTTHTMKNAIKKIAMITCARIRSRAESGCWRGRITIYPRVITRLNSRKKSRMIRDSITLRRAL
jgi:hypothetical protein